MQLLNKLLTTLGEIPGLGFLLAIRNRMQSTRSGVTGRIHDAKFKAREFNDLRTQSTGAVGGGKKKGKRKKKGKDVEEPQKQSPASPGDASNPQGSPQASRGPSAPAPDAIPGVHVSRRKNLREERERDKEMRRRRS